MKTFRICLLLLAFATTLPARLSAQQMNYQGRLTDASGNPLQDGQYTLTFEIWDSPTDGQRVWGPFVTDGGSGNGHGLKADVVNGRFNVILGANDASSRPLTNAFGATRFLQIAVSQNPPLLPRQQILAAPESLHAYQSDHATIADGINGSLNITADFQVGGNSTLNGTVTSPAAASFGSISSGGGLSLGGDLNVTGLAKFGTTGRQMINLLGLGYGIGVQDSTEYFRTASGFAWYKNGSHVSAANNPGPGGQTLMAYDNNGLSVYGQNQFTASFQNQSKGPNVSFAGWGTTGDWYLRSSANNGSVIIQDIGGGTRIGGNVAIGNGASDFPLHVYSTVNHNFNQQVGDLQNYNGGIFQHQSGASDYSIVCQGALWAPSYQATSDRRIKSVDHASDTSKDLETVGKLKVTDYHYIDKESNDARAQKGFIAQEVQQVIPDAVSSGPGYIPSIYADALKVSYNSEERRLTILVSKPHELQKGDKVRLLTEKSNSLELEVEASSSDKEFTVANCLSEPGRVFVYGKRIPDLLNVNYDRIFSTGIGAIQELAKRVNQVEENQRQIVELQRKADRVDELEAKLRTLKELVTRLAQTQKISPAQVVAVR